MIYYGSTGEGEKLMQWMLNQHGAALEVDGVIGNESTKAQKHKSTAGIPDEPRSRG